MTEVEILREALERIKAKFEMWQQAAQSTGAAKAVPPWWNLGDIASAALKKAARQGVEPIGSNVGEIRKDNYFYTDSDLPA